MIDDRDKLALFLIVLALFCSVFGGFLTKAMEYIGSLGEFEVPERDQSPYLYKGAGEGEKDRVETVLYEPGNYCGFCCLEDAESHPDNPDVCRSCGRFFA